MGPLRSMRFVGLAVVVLAVAGCKSPLPELSESLPWIGGPGHPQVTATHSVYLPLHRLSRLPQILFLYVFQRDSGFLKGRRTATLNLSISSHLIPFYARVITIGLT